MSITWGLKNIPANDVPAKIRDQYVSMDKHVLCLRNPWVADAVFMAKMYTSSNVAMALFLGWGLFEITRYSHAHDFQNLFWTYTIGSIIFLSFISLLAGYRIFYIKRLSDLHLNNKTRKIYYQRNRELVILDWDNVDGGIYRRFEFGGNSFSTSYALALAQGNSRKTSCGLIATNLRTQIHATFWRSGRTFASS